MSSDEQPFTLSVSQDTLDTLAKKLALATLPCPAPTTYTDSEDAQDWTYGVPRSTLERLVHHWRTSFLPSWREHEQTLNALPQFTRSIEVDGHGVFTAHYVHKKSEDRRRNAIPLLFLHGCAHHLSLFLFDIIDHACRARAFQRSVKALTTPHCTACLIGLPCFRCSRT